MSISDQSSASLSNFPSAMRFSICSSHEHLQLEWFGWTLFGDFGDNLSSATLFMILHVSFRNSCELLNVFLKSSGSHLQLHGWLLLLVELRLSTSLFFLSLSLPLPFNRLVLEFLSQFDNWLRFTLPVSVEIDVWLFELLDGLWQQRFGDAWLCWTFSELLVDWLSFDLQFLWQWRHTDILSLLAMGLDLTVI